MSSRRITRSMVCPRPTPSRLSSTNDEQSEEPGPSITEDASSPSDTELERWACVSCKTKQVKCNKSKRGCSYCTEREWECVYPRDRIPYRPPAIACRSCHDRKTKCEISEDSKPACTKCSDSPKSCSYHPDYNSGNERDRIPYKPLATACGSCHTKKKRCEITERSKPACTKCSASRTECSFQTVYGSGSVHNQDTDGLPEAEEEIRSRPTSPAGSESRPEQTMEAEGSGTSRVQPPVTEVHEFQLPLITPQLERLDYDRTEAPELGIREEGEAVYHHRDADNMIHPFHWGLK